MAKLPIPAGYSDPNHLPPKSVLAEIGRIACVSAGIEDIIHGLHWKFSKMGAAVGQVVTGDIKPSRLTEDVIRIAQAANIRTAIIEDLKDVFSEYKSTAMRRNQLVHWLWEIKREGNKYVLIPPKYKSGEPLKITLSEIREIADKLVWLETRLGTHELPNKELKSEREKLGAEADMYAPAPWLHKSPALNPKRGKNRGSRKSPQPRRQPSQT